MKTAKLVWVALLCVAAAMLAQQSSPYETALKNLRFRAIGPATMGGRVDDLAVVEIGSAHHLRRARRRAGSSKRSTAARPGSRSSTTSRIPRSATSRWRPPIPSILYVGTGEPNNRQSSSWGNGVYKSMDAGATWTHLGLKETHHIGRDRRASDESRHRLRRRAGRPVGTQQGARRLQEHRRRRHLDTDARTSTRTPASPISRSTRRAPTSSTPRRTSAGAPCSATTAAARAAACTARTDGGAHWTQDGTRGLPATGDLGRCAIDIYRKNTNIVYALVEHATLGGVYRSEDKGATWTRMSDTNPRPSYFSQIRVDPNNDQKIWLGGVNIYMSEDGGRTFDQTRFRDVHSDVHAIWIDPANSDHLVIGNDGGVVVTTDDSGRTWRHINNIAARRSSTKSPTTSRSRTTCAAACRTTTPGAARVDHAADTASPTRTGSRCRAATASTAASTRPIPTSSTPNRRTAISRAATCGPANRNPSVRRRTTTRRRATASSGIRR